MQEIDLDEAVLIKVSQNIFFQTSADFVIYSLKLRIFTGRIFKIRKSRTSDSRNYWSN